MRDWKKALADVIAIGLLGGCVSPAVKEVAADVRRKPAAKFEGWENEWPRE
jgi:hypothetical protein